RPIGGIVSRALALVPASGAPRTELTVRLSGVAVNGVPAEITSDGLAVGGQSAVTAAQLAMFNDGVAALQQAGITVRALPTAKDVSANLGEVRGAAVEIRYEEADAIGGDEQFLLGRVMARSVAVRRTSGLELAPPDVSAPSLGGTEPSSTGAADSTTGSTNGGPSLGVGAPGVSGGSSVGGSGSVYGTSAPSTRP